MFAHCSIPEGDIGCLLALAGGYKPPTGFCHKPLWGHQGTTDQGSSPALFRAFHKLRQDHCGVSELRQKTCSLGEQISRAPSIPTLFWRIPDKPPRWNVAAEPRRGSGILGRGGEEFNPAPETRLDGSALWCNKVLVNYKGDREGFWHKHQKGAERAPPC